MLLHAAMTGQTIRFTRQDSVEEQWRIMQPLLDNPPPVKRYKRGSWGPAEADGIIRNFEWEPPWLPDQPPKA